MNETTLKKLSLMDKNLIHKEDENIDFKIIEKKKDGEGEITIHHNNPCIVIEKLEDHKSNYFKNKKCADYSIFEYKENSYILHIFEFKKSVSTKTFESIKDQFQGGILHSITFSSYLETEFDLKNVILYTAFRNDKITRTKNTIEQRLNMASSNIRQSEREWNTGIVNFKLWEDTPFKFKHKKIQLDLETGKADYTL